MDILLFSPASILLNIQKLKVHYTNENVEWKKRK